MTTGVRDWLVVPTPGRAESRLGAAVRARARRRAFMARAERWLKRPGQLASHVNVADAERLVSSVLGGALLFAGLRRGASGGIALAVLGGVLVHRGVGGHCYAYQALGLDSQRAAERQLRRQNRVTRSITIGKPASELYDFFLDPRNVARIMAHFAEVTASDRRLHWKLHGKGLSAEWDTIVVEDRPNELRRFRAHPEARFFNEGSISFRPALGDLGTEVTLRLDFDVQSSLVGRALTRISGFVAEEIAATALRRFKSLVETGEIPTSERDPSARTREPRG